MMRTTMLALAVALSGCAGVADQDLLSEEGEGRGKADAWNTANDPSRVDSSFKYDILAMPLKGEAKRTPWPGDYWATARDSINNRWNGDDLSPAEKVAKAFNLPDFPKWVTDNVGIYGHGAKECDTYEDCASEKDGSSCVKPRGATGEKAGRCIPNWWGICHGWAPAAVAEAQAVKEVNKNGVTFYPGDLEALASFAYQSSLPVKFLSERCNEKASELEGSGRVSRAECRDMNPGSMFVLLGNMLGLRGKGLVEDRTFDYQVWNQPVRSYEITNGQDGKVKEITKGEAIELVGGSFWDKLLKRYGYNADSVRFFHVAMTVRYITESSPGTTPHSPDSYTSSDSYEFVLEANRKGEAIGGEWIGSSTRSHPDFMWWPTGAPSSSQGGLTYTMVKQLIDAAH
jgi:hypothetical protein